MRIKNYLWVMVIALFCSCVGQNKYNDPVKVFDVDIFKPVDVDFTKEFVSHKNFDSLNQFDTLRLSADLISLKRAMFIQKNQNSDQSDIVYSDVTLYYSGQIVFHLDSVLTIGMYCYNDSLNLITIPIITSQDPETLQTEADFYLCDIKTKSCEKINSKPILNSSYALIYDENKLLIYSDANTLYSYNITNKRTKSIAEFSNPLISVYKLDRHDDTLDIYYFDNFSEAIYNDAPMRKVGIDLCSVHEFCQPISEQNMK